MLVYIYSNDTRNISLNTWKFSDLGRNYEWIEVREASLSFRANS